MGTLIGHVAPGFGFFLIGFWHLYNHIKLHLLHNRYRSVPWFPTPFLRYLELYLIMIGCSASVSMELFIGPDRHQPFDPDGTIPSNHLQNFEHSSISLTFFFYAFSAILLDKLRPKSHHDILQFIGAVAFSQEFLLFHLHSADHMGVEGQYHWLLQSVIFVSLSTTLLGIAWPKSFIVSYVRSLSILFQGVWLMIMGFMLWDPELIAKGCFMHLEMGHAVVRCDGEESLRRAKSLVNIGFSWCLILLCVFAVAFYLLMVKIYGGDNRHKYLSITSKEEEEEDVEAQKKNLRETQSFVPHGKSTAAIHHMER